MGRQGLREKDLVLDVAQRLGRLIEARMGSEVIFTRSDDTFVPLERRTEIANEAKADLFLSIHANSSPLRSAAGVETYYLNFTTSRARSTWPRGKTPARRLSVYELQGLLQKIALKDKVEESREFATPRADRAVHLVGENDGRALEGSRRKEGSVRGVDRRVHAVGAGGNRVRQQRARRKRHAARGVSRAHGRGAVQRAIELREFAEPFSGGAAALAESSACVTEPQPVSVGAFTAGGFGVVSEHLHAVAARFLRNVQRLVGLADQRFLRSSARPAWRW